MVNLISDDEESDATVDDEGTSLVDGWLRRAPSALRDDSLRDQLEHVAARSRKACTEALFDKIAAQKPRIHALDVRRGARQ